MLDQFDLWVLGSVQRAPFGAGRPSRSAYSLSYASRALPMCNHRVGRNHIREATSWRFIHSKIKSSTQYIAQPLSLTSFWPPAITGPSLHKACQLNPFTIANSVIITAHIPRQVSDATGSGYPRYLRPILRWCQVRYNRHNLIREYILYATSGSGGMKRDRVG